MELGQSIRSGTKWLFTASLGGQLMQFVFGIILARLLVPADFGLIVTIQVFTGFVSMIASGGMGEALIQAKEVKEEDYQAVFTFQLFTGILIYLGFFLISPWFADWFDNPIYEDLLKVSALTFLTRPFGNNPAIRLRREMRFKEIAVIGVIVMVISSSASVFMAVGGAGVWSLVLGGLTGAVMNITLLWWKVRWRPKIVLRNARVRHLAAYGFRSISNELLVYLRKQTNNFLISRILGPGPVGLYNKAESLSQMPVMTISGSAYQTVFRALSKVQDDLPQSKYLYFRSLTLVTVYTLPFYVLLGWLAEPFIVGVFGEHWRGTAEPLAILSLTGLFTCLENQSGALVAARNRLDREIWLQLQTWGIMATGCLLGISHGLVGPAWAVVAASVYICFRLTSLAMGLVHGRLSDMARSLRPPLILAAVQLSGMYVMQQILSLGVIRGDNMPLAYLLIVGMTGMACYVLSFLFIPIAGIESEARRWRDLLKTAFRLPLAS